VEQSEDAVSTEQPWTIGRLLDWTTQFLQGKGVASARLEAELLLAHALGCQRIILYTRHGDEPQEAQRTQFRELVLRRVKGHPVAHLLGRKEFFSLEFEVGPAVLIPRPETELVAMECLALLKPLGSPQVLDLGTGSGCLAVAIARNHKGAAVTATDVSADALAVARRNVEKHRLGERVRLLEGDLFAALPPGERFHVIVSNPPYIRTADLSGLAVEVREHEPRLALDGGADGLAVIERIAAGAADHLEQGGSLLVEIGYDQDTEARSRLGRHGWQVEKTIPDGAGHPRVLRARRA
jgi:release factor glutamine methyltransferase